MHILNTNYKLRKDKTATIYGISLAPHKQSGTNLCPQAGACSELCVGWFRGLNVFPTVRKALVNRSRLFVDDRKTFLGLLHKDLTKLEKKPNPHCRLNVFSDLPWETIDPSIFEYNIKYYDYTKIKNRCIRYIEGRMPNNYHICFSHSEKSSFEFANEVINSGGSVAFVINRKYIPSHGIIEDIPEQLMVENYSWQTIDGDKTDIRTPEYNSKGVAVCLRAKMAQHKIPHYIDRGFILDV